MKWSALNHMQSFMAWDEGCTGPLIKVLPDVTVETRLIPQIKIKVFLERERAKCFADKKQQSPLVKWMCQCLFYQCLCVCVNIMRIKYTFCGKEHRPTLITLSTMEIIDQRSTVVSICQ